MVGRPRSPRDRATVVGDHYVPSSPLPQIDRVAEGVKAAYPLRASRYIPLMPTAFTRIPSPLGELTLAASDTALTAVYFPTSHHVPPLHVVKRGTGGEGWLEDDGSGPAGAVLARTREQLNEYFARTRTTFDLPLDPAGSAFERRVWDALRAIPYGSTVSYGELARRLGDPRATRAVGAANGKNAIPIIVPCHRVVGARGELTGFGGGLDRKRWLLEHEGAALALGY